MSQSVGVFFPTKIDNYVTIVRGFRRYGRYMYDMYLIHQDRAYLEETVNGICKLATENGLFINEKKTHIANVWRTRWQLCMKRIVNFFSITGRSKKWELAIKAAPILHMWL